MYDQIAGLFSLKRKKKYKGLNSADDLHESTVQNTLTFMSRLRIWSKMQKNKRLII